MTITSEKDVRSSNSSRFIRLLFKWHRSLYKLIYRELLVFLIIFGLISALYRHGLATPNRRIFERIVAYCDIYMSHIPLTFILGFYVAAIASRWWRQYHAIPWPDEIISLLAMYVIGNDEYGRMIRRSLVRYLNLSLILALRPISSVVKRRFPTLDHVVESGSMTALELELFQSVSCLTFDKFWIPGMWSLNLLKEAQLNDRIPDPRGLSMIINELNKFKSKCLMLRMYHNVSLPLVYTQVVTLATYSFFAAALMGRQYTESEEKPLNLELDSYISLSTVFQFFFYMGLLKVAEQLLDPYGDDDEDLDMNWLIDRHIKISYLGVDTIIDLCPPLVKDVYFDSENLISPYSVINMIIPDEKQTMFSPNVTKHTEVSKTEPTLRTSTAILEMHPDSPILNKCQINGFPSAVLKVTQEDSETIVQLDIQDSQIDGDKSQSSHSTEALEKSKIEPERWLEMN